MTWALRRRMRLAVMGCCGLLAAIAPAFADTDAAYQPAVPGMTQEWLTQWHGPDKLTRYPDLAFAAGPAEPLHIVVDRRIKFQEMVGFGASVTDASAFVLQHFLDDEQRQSLVQELFSREAGIGLDFVRVTIGASDFSLEPYSLDDVPPGETDAGLEHFSIDANREELLPVLRAALAINPQLKVMASPWSAPAWMKTSGSLVKGQLREEAYGPFAQYLSRFVDAFAAEGVPMYAITLQNEPHFEPPNYPGMRLTPAARSRLIGEFVGPLFAERHPQTRILEWDHNWNELDAPLLVLQDPGASRYVSGVAWHCYGGFVAAQSTFHMIRPDKETYITECSGGGWEPPGLDPLTQFAGQLIAGGIRGWAKGVLLWNLALDEDHGPRLGGCPNCRGVVTIDSHDGRVTRNPEYYALAHYSRFVLPGARRIASSQEEGGLDNVAFENPDGSVVLVVVNGSKAGRRFSAGEPGCRFVSALPAHSVGTYVWTNPGKCGL